jgi:hypothetical protein
MYVEEITNCIPEVPTLTYVWAYTFTLVLVFKGASVPTLDDCPLIRPIYEKIQYAVG